MSDDLVERLREASRNEIQGRPQRVSLPSWLGKAADEITRLRARLAEAQPVAVTDIAPKTIDERWLALDAGEPFIFDPATGFCFSPDVDGKEHGTLWTPSEPYTASPQPALGDAPQGAVQVGWAYNDARWDADRWHVCGLDSRPRPGEGRKIEPIFIASPTPPTRRIDRDTVERCAQVAETPHEDDDGLDRQVRKQVAAAIRALVEEA